MRQLSAIFVACLLLVGGRAYPHGAEGASEDYLAVFDSLVQQLDEASTPSSPTVHFGSGVLFSNGDAFSAAVNQVVKQHLQQVKLQCAQCDLNAAEADARGRLARLWSGVKSWGGYAAHGARYAGSRVLTIFDSTIRAGLMFVRHPIKTSVAAGASVLDEAADLAVETRGTLRQTYHRRGIVVALGYLVWFPTSELFEHFFIPIPPNPATCAALQGVYFTGAGSVQDAIRLSANGFVPQNYARMLSRAAIATYYRFAFSRRVRHLNQTGHDHLLSRRALVKNLIAEGRHVEALLARSPFWSELIEGSPEEEDSPHVLSSPFSEAHLSSDLDAILDTNVPQVKRLWRLERYVAGFQLLKELLQAALSSIRHETKESHRPMSASYFSSVHGHLGDLVRLTDYQKYDLFAAATSREIPELEKRKKWLVARQEQLLDLVNVIRRHLEGREMLHEVVTRAAENPCAEAITGFGLAEEAPTGVTDDKIASR